MAVEVTTVDRIYDGGINMRATFIRASITTAAVVVTAVAVPSPGIGATRTPVAYWKMNEGPGASVMRDSSGHGIRGAIGAAVITGKVSKGATAYAWPKAGAGSSVARPERLVTVKDSRLNPGNGNFAVTVRFRTLQQSFGNMVQKGQASNPGGFWKVESNRGQVKCVFRGTDAGGGILSNGVTSGAKPLNDGAWHKINCERTRDRLTMTIDGARVRHAPGRTGTISNAAPLTIGGKGTCDQVQVSCDYYVGHMDYLRIFK